MDYRPSIRNANRPSAGAPSATNAFGVPAYTLPIPPSH
jgi:hypothetical protein